MAEPKWYKWGWDFIGTYYDVDVWRYNTSIGFQWGPVHDSAVGHAVSSAYVERLAAYGAWTSASEAQQAFMLAYMAMEKAQGD